jgi:hypothetical protein
MARKKESELTHPGRAHPTFTIEEAKERERQRQRDKRIRRKLEKGTASSNVRLQSPGAAVRTVQSESSSKDIMTPCTSGLGIVLTLIFFGQKAGPRRSS